MERDNKKLNIVIIVLLFAIVLMTVLALIGLKNAKEELETDSLVETESQTETTEKWQEGAISYNGKKYRYNSSIKSYLIMGIDKDEKVTTAKDGISGGQSDALFLVVENGKTKEFSVIAINRNSMTTIDVYDKEGSYIGKATAQICLQHGYGDGKRVSCQRSADAVSKMFYNIPISGYFALNMGGISLMNEAVGGVEVEVLHDIETKNASLKQGDIVTLNGEEAYAYLRSRDVNEFDSATYRLERQKQYIIQLVERMKEMAAQDEKSLFRVYSSIEDYTVSNIDFADLIEDAAKYEFDESHLYTVPGETVMGEQFEEYYIDEDGLYELIIEVFYECIEE